jgi:hypothetical protein
MVEGMSGRRGQLLLIAGLGIAMTLVVLAIVLNTVIFTQNLATREAVDTRTPVEFTNAVEQGVGGIMVEANHWNTTDYGTLDTAFKEAVTTWAGNATYLAASKGTSADVSLEGTTNGTRVIQESRGAWENQSGTSDWQIATSTERIRRFHVNVSHTDLVSEDDTGLPTSDAFRINVSETSGADNWILYIYENQSDSSRIDATAIRPDGTKTTCSASHAELLIDITEAQINGTSCGFTFADNISSPYNISIENGDRISAKYTFVVNTDHATFSSAHGADYDFPPSYTSPYAVPAIYSADVNVTVERADIEYQRIVTIAPENVPSDERYDVTT